MNVSESSRSARPAVSIGVDQTDTAHRLMPLDLGDDMARYGIAECGFPAEHLTLVPKPQLVRSEALASMPALWHHRVAGLEQRQLGS